MINEHKKGFKAKKYPVHTKPATLSNRNPVAKNSKMAGKAGEHNNPKTAISQPRKAKHKKVDMMETVISVIEGEGYDDAKCTICGTAFKNHFRFDDQGKPLTSLVRHPGRMEQMFPGLDHQSKPQPVNQLNRNEWVKKVKQQYPDAQISLSKMPNGPAMAKLNGKTIASFDPSKGISRVRPAQSVGSQNPFKDEPSMGPGWTQKGVAEDEGDAEGLKHLTPDLATHISQQIDSEGIRAIEKSIEWGDGAADELVDMIKDMLDDYAAAEKEIHETFDAFEEYVEAHGLSEDAYIIYTDEEILTESEAWQKSSGKSKSGGLNKKGVASYRRSHPGSKLQTAVTTKPSKLKKGSKASNRRKSFCARMKGMKKHRTGAATKRDPNSRINKSLRKWHCESLDQLRYMIEYNIQLLESSKLNEKWSQKYKKSINCSHPKGFSQRAHCQGKKKHNESIEMEMTCPDCGMCETHGNLNEIKKGQKDSNGYSSCWTGYHAAGTKKGKNGGRVRNCVPNEDIEEGYGRYYCSTDKKWKTRQGPKQTRSTNEARGIPEAEEKRTMSRAAKGVMKYGKDGMKALAKAGKDGKDLDKVRDKYNKYDEAANPAQQAAIAIAKKKSGKYNKDGKRKNEDVDLKHVHPSKFGDTGEYDMEGDYVKNQIHTMIRVLSHLERLLDDNENLPEWVEEKLSQSKGMVVSVMDYIVSEKERSIEKSRGQEITMNESLDEYQLDLANRLFIELDEGYQMNEPTTKAPHYKGDKGDAPQSKSMIKNIFQHARRTAGVDTGYNRQELKHKYYQKFNKSLDTNKLPMPKK